jgi:hypothetical protein
MVAPEVQIAAIETWVVAPEVQIATIETRIVAAGT